MKKKIYAITNKCRLRFIEFCILKTTVFTVALLSITGVLSAQEQAHEHDTVRVLSKQVFNAQIVSTTNNQLKLDVLYTMSDSITPMFLEISAFGFEFNDNCILQQSINNVNVENNIEKIWGPALVSLGVGILPPNGRFTTSLALLNDFPPGAYIKVRIFGEVGGHDVLWSSIVKK